MNRPQTAHCINLTRCRCYLQYFLARLKGEFRIHLFFFTLLWFDHFLLSLFGSPDMCVLVYVCMCVHSSVWNPTPRLRLLPTQRHLVGGWHGWQAWLQQQGVELAQGKGGWDGVWIFTFCSSCSSGWRSDFPFASAHISRVIAHEYLLLSVVSGLAGCREFGERRNLLFVPFEPSLAAVAPAKPSTHLSEPTQVIRDHAATFMSESTPLLLSWPQPRLSVPPSVLSPRRCHSEVQAEGAKVAGGVVGGDHGGWGDGDEELVAGPQLEQPPLVDGVEGVLGVRGPALCPHPLQELRRRKQSRWEVGDTSCPVGRLWLKPAANTGLKSVYYNHQ